MEPEAKIIAEKPLKPNFADWLELISYPVLAVGCAFAAAIALTLLIIIPLVLVFMARIPSLSAYGLDPLKLLSNPSFQGGEVAFLALLEISMAMPVFFVGFSLKRFSWESFGIKILKYKWQWLVESILFVVAVNGLEYLVRYLEKAMKFKIPEFSSQNLDILIPKSNSVWLFIVFVISIGIIGPICEELLFRGAVFGWLRRYYKPWVAILVSSLFFGMLHYETLTRMIFAILAGAYMAWMYEREKTLAAPITLHILNNSVVICLLFFAPNFGSV